MSAYQQNEWLALRDSKLLAWLKGNQDAVDAVNTITSICDVWDDLVDRDKPVSEESVNAAFAKALAILPSNPFYRQHQAQFIGVIVLGINAWLDANVLQRGATERKRMLAFYLRTFGFEVLHLAAFLVGGYDHMRRISGEMRMFFERETYSQWEHRHGME